MGQLTIQIYIYYLIYLDARKAFCKIMQHNFCKEVSVFNGRLTNDISCFKSNWFTTQNIKFRLMSRNLTYCILKLFHVTHPKYYLGSI